MRSVTTTNRGLGPVGVFGTKFLLQFKTKRPRWGCRSAIRWFDTLGPWSHTLRHPTKKASASKPFPCDGLESVLVNQNGRPKRPKQRRSEAVSRHAPRSPRSSVALRASALRFSVRSQSRSARSRPTRNGALVMSFPLLTSCLSRACLG